MVTIKLPLKGVELMPHYRSRRTTPIEAVEFLFSYLSFIIGFAFLVVLAIEFLQSNHPNPYRIGFIATM